MLVEGGEEREGRYGRERSKGRREGRECRGEPAAVRRRPRPGGPAPRLRTPVQPRMQSNRRRELHECCQHCELGGVRDAEDGKEV